MRNMLISTCFCVGFSVVATACGPVAVSDQAVNGSRCLSLSEPGTPGPLVSLPSRISWLFRVDTCRGEPVAGLGAQQFEVYEDGKKVSLYESQQRVAPKGEHYRLYSVVLLDLSGSVLRSGDFPKLEASARTYLETVLSGMGDGHRVQLMTFDGRAEPQVLVPFTSDLATLKAGLASLEQTECSTSNDCARFSDHRTCAGWRCVDDSTNLNGAVVRSLQVLDSALAGSGVAWRDGALVLFTDGTDQAARMSTADALDAVKRSPQHTFTIGLGGEVDADVLRQIGKDGAWPVSKADELQAAFSEIAARVAGLANRFYTLEYCSPKRTGTHQLKVVATANTNDGELLGQLSGQFDATGFESGCSLSP
ncbi:MAG: VWA domain-containing protein [Myxococcaceae bacterium]